LYVLHMFLLRGYIVCFVDIGGIDGHH
jgi:hypothetical protein